MDSVSDGYDSEVSITAPNLEINEVQSPNYEDKEDPMEILDHVKINNTLESPLSTIKGVFNDSKQEDPSFNKAEMKSAEARLRAAFIEFYQKLRLLNHYR